MESKPTLVTWQQKTLSSTSFLFCTGIGAIFSLKSECQTFGSKQF